MLYDDEAVTLVRWQPAQPVRRARSKLHWAVIAMGAFLALALAFDPIARHEVLGEARGTAARVISSPLPVP